MLNSVLTGLSSNTVPGKWIPNRPSLCCKHTDKCYRRSIALGAISMRLISDSFTLKSHNWYLMWNTETLHRSQLSPCSRDILIIVAGMSLRSSTPLPKTSLLSKRHLPSHHCRGPFGIVFWEQRYSSLHSGQSLARDNFRGIIANLCGNIADPCSDWWLHGHWCSDWRVQVPMPMVEQPTKHYKTLLNIVKHS